MQRSPLRPAVGHRTVESARRAPTPLALLASLGLLWATATPAAAQRYAPERGEYGDVYPQPASVLLEETVLHADRSGGSRQQLLDLAGDGGGFAAVWRDTRYGNLGLVLALADPDGAPRRPERPVHEPLTSRQFDPAVAVAGDAGAVAWYRTAGRNQQTVLRLFDARGVFAPGTFRLGEHPGGGRAAGSRHPALALAAEGRGCVLWIDDGVVRGQRFLFGTPEPTEAGRGARVVPGGPDGPVFELWPDGPQPIGSPELVALPGGGLVACWATDDGLALWREDARGVRRRLHGLDRPARLIADVGGAALVVEESASVVLRPLDDRLQLGDPVTLSDRAVGWLDVAAGVSGWVLARASDRDEGPSAGEGRADGDGEPARPAATGGIELVWTRRADVSTSRARPSTLTLATVQGDGVVRLATSGDQVLVAFTDLASADPDVQAVALPFGLEDPLELPAPVRWNDDGPSADQSEPAVASNGRDAGVVAWQDERDGTPRPWARRLGADGAPVGAEFPLESEASEAGGLRPAVAMAEDGRFLAAWKVRDRAGREARLALRVFGPDGEPLGPVRLQDGEHAVDTGWPAAVEAAPDGWICLWTRAGGGAWVQQLGPDGAPTRAAVELPSPAEGAARHPDLCGLDGGGWAAVWDLVPRGGTSVVTGAILDRSLRVRVGPLRFEPSPRGSGDLQPAVAPAEDGGFLLLWTGNDGPPRDVFGRFVDARGRSDGEPMALSVLANEQDYPDVLRLPDGSWLTSWEDDISGADHVAARRIRRDRSLGPRVTLSRRESSYVVDRTGNRLALFGDRVALACTSRARSLGLDAVLRVFGAGFDAGLEVERGR